MIILDTNVISEAMDIAAIASAKGFAVATRDISAFQAANVQVIDPWNTVH